MTEGEVSGPRPGGAVVGAGRVRTWIAAAPAYPGNAGDLATVDVLGLRLPVRATIAVVTVTLVLLLDYHGRIDGIMSSLLGADPANAADLKRVQSVGRLILLGIVPLAVIVFLMRDRPSRYGVRVGDWRGRRPPAPAGGGRAGPPLPAHARRRAPSPLTRPPPARARP